MNNFQLYLSLFFGAIPYDHLNVKANVIQSYWHMYITPMIYLTCFGLFRFGPFGLNDFEKCESICTLSDALFVYLGLGMYLSIHFFTLWRRKQFFIDFEKSLYVIDDSLSKCDKLGVRKEKKKKLNNCMYYFTWLLVILFFALATGFEVKEFLHFYKEYFFIPVMVSSFPYFASSIVMGLFSYYVSEISIRFSKLNELFERINNETDRKHESVMIFDIETDVKRDMPLNQELRHRHNADNATIIKENDELNSDAEADFKNTDTRAADSITSEANMPELFKLHDKILALSELTNREFGPQCVPYLTVCFVITILGIFLQCKVFVKSAGTNRLVDYVVLIYLFWSLATIFVAYLALRMCSIANGYSKQSAIIVHNIMQKKPAFMLGNDVYYNKMKSFTLQFLHWEGYFEFNGVGLYVMDYTFLFACICAGTSYLIVLLQFDMTLTLKEEGLLL